ncbi:MAG TPA: TraB/GumN family protein [Ruminococcus sp.]
MKKKILCTVMAAMLTASMSSCGDSKDSGSEGTSAVTSEKTTDETVSESIQTSEAEASANKETGSTGESSSENDSEADFNDYITHDGVTPALWKATDPATGHELYLMGTIHIMGEDTVPLPDYIMDVYNKCSGVAVEYDVVSLQSDMSQITEYYSKMVYRDGTKISDHISKETYEAAKKLLTDAGAYNQMLDYYCPGFWISSIQSLAFTKIENMELSGIDADFITKAKNDGKEVVNIETLDIQASVSMGYSDALADFMLRDVTDTYSDAKLNAESVAELYNLWAKGDVELMADIEDSETELPEELESDYAEYEDIAIYKRNAGMAEKASEYLKDGKNYFFMVGALHFAGDKGVDDLLEDMGYKVERVK